MSPASAVSPAAPSAKAPESARRGMPYHKLWLLHVRLLLKKNANLLRRNLSTTLLQLFLPLLMMLLLWLVTLDDSAINGPTFELRSPETYRVGSLPTCNVSKTSACVSPLALVHPDLPTGSGGGSAVALVASSLLAANPHVTDVLYFDDADALTAHAQSQPGALLAAVSFAANFSLHAPDFTVHYKQARTCLFAEYHCNSPWSELLLPVQTEVERAVLEVAARQARQDESVRVRLELSHSSFAHPDKSDLSLDLAQIFGLYGAFFFMCTVAVFAIQLTQLVSEKELKLRLLMRMMGVRDSAVWVANLVQFVLTAAVASLMFILSTYIFGIKLMAKNDFSLCFCLLFLTYLSMSGLATFFAPFVPRASMATAVGIFFFFFSYILSSFTPLLFLSAIPPPVRNLIALIPPVTVVRGFGELFDASEGNKDGMRWDERFYRQGYDPDAEFPDPDDNIFPLSVCLEWLLIDSILYLSLGIYFDLVVPSGPGRVNVPWFPFLPSYWTGRKDCCAHGTVLTTNEPDASDSDVRAEEVRVAGGGADHEALHVVNLQKRFGSSFAVRRVSLGIQNETLFCLLGHNGAGKTTTFNMLAGMFKPTRGDAFIFGHSVTTELHRVQALMGICPQHDVLWSELTASEHLALFAGLALLAPGDIPRRVSASLAAVDLSYVHSRPAGKYSGGMKRRLSVACSLISDPRVVYLDEPTTGMDPVNRRGVWDAIEKAKAGRVIVLTTHAMEEADTLGDAIGIMSHGALLCLGSSLHLKSKFGSGYRVDLSAPHSRQQDVCEWVKQKLPHAQTSGESSVVATVPLDKLSLISEMYAELQTGICGGAQMAVSMCSLEDVFIKLAGANQDHSRGAAPPQQQQGTPTAAAAQAQVAFTASCPEGSEAGGQIDVTKPDGSALRVTVPPGVRPGDVFQVLIDRPQSLASQPVAVAVDPIGDPDGLLAAPLPFGRVPFAWQLRAVLRKNATFQMRQKKTNCCTMCCSCTFLIILIVVAITFQLIIGGPLILCSPYVSKYPTAPGSPIAWLTSAGKSLDAVDEAVVELCKDTCLTNTARDRDSDKFKTFNGYLLVGMCASAENRMERLFGSGLGDSLSSSQEADLLAYAQDFGCDWDLYQQLVPQYTYYRRAADTDSICAKEPRPTLTVEFFGVNQTWDHASCYLAMDVFRATCTQLQEDSCALPEEHAALQAQYACTAGAPAVIAQYKDAVPSAQTLSGEDVSQCTSDYLCAQPSCSRVVATAAYTISADYPQCRGNESSSGGADSRRKLGLEQQLGFAEQLAPRPSLLLGSRKRRLLHVGLGPEGETEGETYGRCFTEAWNYCKRKEVTDVCPGVLTHDEAVELQPMPLGASVDAPAAARLGNLGPANLTDLASTGYDGLHARHAAAIRLGVLGNWTARPAETDVEAGFDFNYVLCAKGGASASNATYSAEPCIASRAELDELMYEQWYKGTRCSSEEEEEEDDNGALNCGTYETGTHVTRWDETRLDFEATVLYNGSFNAEFGVPNQYPIVAAYASRLGAALLKAVGGDEGAEMVARWVDMPDNVENLKTDFSLVAFLGPFYVPAILSLLFPMMVLQLVAEKGGKLREIMAMTGMRRATYWLMSWGWNFLLYMVQMILFLIVAFAVPFDIISAHSFGVSFVLFLLYGMALNSFACFVSTLFSNTRIASVFAVALVIIVIFCAFATCTMAMEALSYETAAMNFGSLIPLVALMKAIFIMSKAAGTFPFNQNSVSLSFSNIEVGGVTPVGTCMLMLFVDFLLYTLLCIYCDLVLPVGPGVKLPANFFLSRTWWRTDKSNGSLEAKPPEPGEPDDVSAERARVSGGAEAGLCALGLHKAYRGSTHAAVENVQFGIKPGECFGLLGSNGAGKTTVIHIFCGIHAPSSGTVLVNEEGTSLDIRRHLVDIHGSMGICSQDNLLWDDLRGDEHLRFFGRMRRLSGTALEKHVNYWLRRVNLHSPAYRRLKSRAYSGGMKRRLSVATAFIGNPRLVYLDEPSTGLDPESRRQLWHAVIAAQKGKCMILTTHALDEANALCSRVGIMTNGLMRTLGTPTELRLRFDAGYKLVVSCGGGSLAEAEVDTFVRGLLPHAALRDHINGMLTYAVPRDSSLVLGSVFQVMEEHKAKLQVQAWAISDTTLEEVFLQIVAATSTKGAAVKAQPIELPHVLAKPM